MNRIAQLIVVALVAVLGGFGGAWLYGQTGLGNQQTRTWLLAHPEILPQMVDRLQQREASARLTPVLAEVERPFPGAVLGNPTAKHTIVEFSDYACGYCRQSFAEVKALVAANPDIKVVVREWPIFEGSDVPARMALAAAQQGKYAAFHDAMFEHAPPTVANIQLAAKQAGLDMAAAEKFGQSQAVTFELQKNQQLARQLGFEGTPSWVAGGKVFSGASDRQRLIDAVKPASGNE